MSVMIGSEREPAVVIASDVPMGNMLTNMIWERGLLYKQALIDWHGSALEPLMNMVRDETVRYVFAEDLRILGMSYGKISDNLSEMRKHNITVVFPEWELDPMHNGYYAVICALADLAAHDSRERSKVISIGRREGVICNVETPPKRRLPMKEIADMRLKNYGWATIAKKIDVPRSTIMNRRKDIEQYMEENGYFNRKRKK